MARVSSSVHSESLLVAALEGLEIQRKRIEDQIDEVRSLLRSGKSARAASAAGPKPPGRRKLSEAARKRIAAAQKRRWAAYRKATNNKQE